MILRDLLARLGLQVDPRGFRQADRSIEGVAGSLRALVAGFAAIAGAAGFGRLIGLASDANETMNVLRAAFGANQEQVEGWAESLSGQVGRSEFRLREMAGVLGSLLNPLMDGNTQAAADMSTQLSALAVDLGSFFNVADDDALIALRAGISGESEPLKRFGVLLNEAALEQTRVELGIRKTVKQMTIAEKTQLRFATIMRFTASAQGDAARTSEGFANASKALKDSLRDLGTRIGLVALPAVERLLRRSRDAVKGLRDLVATSNLAEGAFGALALAAAIAAPLILAPFLPAILAFAKWALVIAAVSLFLDDVITLLRGGRSVVGLFLDEVFGFGTADEFVENHRAGVELMAEAWRNAEGDVVAFFSSLLGFEQDLAGITSEMENLGASLFELTESIRLFFSGGVLKLLEGAAGLVGARDLEKGFAALRADREFGAGLQRSVVRGTGPGSEVAFTGRETRLLANKRAREERQRGRDSRRQGRERIQALETEAAALKGAGADRRRGEIEAEIGRVERESGIAREGRRTVGRGIAAEAELVRFGQGRAVAGAPAAAEVVQDNRIDVTITGGGDPAEVERRLRQVIEERDRRNRRAARSALVPAVEG